MPPTTRSPNARLVVTGASPWSPADATSPSLESIWWSQLASGITHDVATAIKDVNAKSTTVTDSPIKNLLALNIPEDFFPPGVAALAVQAAPLGGGGRGAETPVEGATPPPTGGPPRPTPAPPPRPRPT